MVISISDKGGRRTSGDRRQLDIEEDAVEDVVEEGKPLKERSKKERRNKTEDRRQNDKTPEDEEEEKRALNLFLKKKK